MTKSHNAFNSEARAMTSVSFSTYSMPVNAKSCLVFCVCCLFFCVHLKSRIYGFPGNVVVSQCCFIINRRRCVCVCVLLTLRSDFVYWVNKFSLYISLVLHTRNTYSTVGLQVCFFSLSVNSFKMNCCVYKLGN